MTHYKKDDTAPHSPLPGRHGKGGPVGRGGEGGLPCAATHRLKHIITCARQIISPQGKEIEGQKNRQHMQETALGK